MFSGSSLTIVVAARWRYACAKMDASETLLEKLGTLEKERANLMARLAQEHDPIPVVELHPAYRRPIC